MFLLAAAVGCGLWFGKNWVLTGNPTYPLLYGVFDGKTWNAEKDAQWNRVHRPHDFSAATLGNDLGRVVLTSPWLSPLVVPLAALALLGARRRSRPLAASQRLAWQLFAYAAFVIAVWWLLTHRIDRFWIPVLPVLALLAGAGACWSTDRWWRWLSARAVAGRPGGELPGGRGGAGQRLVRPAGETPQRSATGSIPGTGTSTPTPPRAGC